MSTPLTEHVPSSDLAAIIGEVWGAYLQSEPYPTGTTADGGSDGSLTGVITISGAWAGIVTLTLPAALATDYTARLLMMDAADVTHADITDAVGELINIVGGNVKSLLPEPSALSIPVVTTAAAETARGTVTQTVAFIADDHPFTVTITTEGSHA